VFELYVPSINQNRDGIDAHLNTGNLPDSAPLPNKSSESRELFFGD
jgi:hypothetical protein